jgi:hypothetical protein
MKTLLLLLFPFVSMSGSKELTWDDFKGTPKPDHTAYVSMSIGFEYTDLQDGHYIFEDAAVTIHPESSYSNSHDPYILNHENGHLKIAQIQCNYINNLSHIHHIHYTKEGFEAMKREIIRRWDRMDSLFDEQTQHSINREMQAKWDIKIARMLNNPKYAEIY